MRGARALAVVCVAYGAGTALPGSTTAAAVVTSGSGGLLSALTARHILVPLDAPPRQDGARRFEFQASFGARLEGGRRKARLRIANDT